MLLWVFRQSMILSLLLGTSQLAANIIGSDHQNFNPANSSEDLVTVFRPKTMGQGRLHLGLHFNYGVNTLPYFIDPETDSRGDRWRSYNDSISAMDITMSLGLTDRWDIGLTLPYFVSQSVVEDSGYRGQFSKMGNTEIRANTKYRFYENSLISFATVATANYNRVKNNPYTGDSAWPAFSLELLSELDFGLLQVVGNLGYRWRSSGDVIPLDGEVAIEPFRDQLIFSSGINVPIPGTSVDWITEVYGSYTEEDIVKISTRNPSIIEGITALRFGLPYDLLLQLGVGKELRHSVSSADQRFFAGIGWSFPLPRRRPAMVEEDVVVLSSAAPANYGSAGPERVPDEILIIDDILFEFDSDVIAGEPAFETLQRLSRVFQGPRAIELVVIAGHACVIGTEVYNLDLSQRRADSIVNWLMHRYQVPRERVVPVGFGEMQPTASNIEEAGRRRNRRVEFEIYYEDNPYFKRNVPQQLSHAR